MDHEEYHKRLEFVKSILQLNGLEVSIFPELYSWAQASLLKTIKASKIDTVEFNMKSPRVYNNYIYLVTLSLPTSADASFRSPGLQYDEIQPGTMPLPANATSLIIRLANADPRTGLNNANRVENEVAFMALARQALATSKYSHIVPDVYAWASIAGGQGFTVQQHMPGTMPDKVFNELSIEDKSVVLSQMAEILALLQKFPLPQTVDKFGGLRFDEAGNIVSAQMTIYKGEPMATYEDLIRTIFRVKLGEADDNPIMQGWRDKGVRARLDHFVQHKLGEILKVYQNPKKVLVHSDFSKSTKNPPKSELFSVRCSEVILC